MSKEWIELGEATHVVVECAGDLIVRSGQESAVGVRRGSYQAEQTKEGLTIRSDGSLSLSIPDGTSLAVTAHGNLIVKHVAGEVTVTEAMGDTVLKGLADTAVQVVHGNLVVKNLQGTLKLDTAHGDVILRHVGDVHIGTVHGDLRLHYASGSLALDEVHGDIGLQAISGDVAVRSGQRDINLSNIGGQVQLESVQGDVRLQGGLSGGKHAISAQGDIVVRWPLDAPLNLEATGASIRNRLPLEDVTEEGGHVNGRLGDGKTTLSLNAGGDIVLKPIHYIDPDLEANMGDLESEFEFDMSDFEGLTERITGEINSRMFELSSRLEQKFGPDFAQRVAEKASRKTERAMEQAVRQMERARRRAERSSYAWTPPSPPPPPAKKKATAEEQLQILRMLEKGVISTEEANTLLEALES